MTPPCPNKGPPAEGIIRRKKKLVSSGGQTWFKRGSPKKSGSRGAVGVTLSQPFKLRISEDVVPPVLPPLLVQFSLEGHPDLRLSVFDKICLLSQDGGDEVERPPAKKKIEEPVAEDEAVRKLPEPQFEQIVEYELSDYPGLPNAYIRWMDRGGEELGEEVEYDVDEEDFAWLELVNMMRALESAPAVTLQAMELLMDRLEKESYLQMQSTGMDQRPVIDDDAVCCICMDGECQNSNAILFCDMCNLAVHQECYGVPYIPEGQWLCRRCLQSPSRAVDCVLCPNKGGAFKQTDDGRWAHVVCAIWIPEVCFANTVFLEPVDSVTNIPPARWRLCCFICKYKGRGACIQCHKSNCYTAFHVTCAQHAGLCMKMETVRVGSTVTVRKTAYCDNHAPPDFIRNRDGESPTVRQKLKATRKMLAEKRSAIPMVSIPTIPPDRVSQISSSVVTFPRKTQFIKRLMSYWKLKRIQRNGVPLLRRLQAASSASHHPTSSPTSRPKIQSPLQVESWRGEYKYLMRLRQDLERARLLCELIRKREKMKRETVVVREAEWDHATRPLSLFLMNILNELGIKDTTGIFAEPVDAEEVPDYRYIVAHPMDLSTMKAKVVAFEYYNVKEMELDFNLMIDNCLLYNSKETMFYRAGVKLREAGRFIFREASRLAGVIGFDFSAGTHLLAPPSQPLPLLTDEQILEQIESYWGDGSRSTLPSDKQIALLEDIMDKSVLLRHPLTRKNRYTKLKSELYRLKRVTGNQDSGDSAPNSPDFLMHAENESFFPSPVATPTPRRLPKISETEEQQRSRPPKRQVVKEMEKAAAVKRTSPKRDNITPRPGRRLRNSSAESPEPPSQPASISRKMRDLRSVTNIPGNPMEEGVGGRRRRGERKSPPVNNSNGLSPQPRWSPLKNGPTQPNLRKRGGEGSPVIPVRDSFTTYRTGGDTEINSEGDSANEDPDDDERLTDEEEVDSSESSSEESSQSDSSSSSSLSNWRSRKKDRSSDEQRTSGSEDDEPQDSPDANQEEDEVEEEGRVVLNEEPQNLQDIPLEPLHLVWVWSNRTWSPALIIDPEMSPEFTQNGVIIPCPPPEIVNKRGGRRNRRDSFLVLFFDNNRTWEWVSRGDLEPLGLYPTLDKRRLEEGRKPGEKKSARRAYEKALLHRSSVAGLHPAPLSPESE